MKLELTETEQNIINEGHCPDCNCPVFLHGPSGGASENIRCFHCGAEYNWCIPCSTERIERNEPTLYHGAFRMPDEIKAYYNSWKKDKKTWWQQIREWWSI